MGGSGISWTICKSFALCYRQPHQQLAFRGRMHFLTFNQQCQNTMCYNKHPSIGVLTVSKNVLKYHWSSLLLIQFEMPHMFSCSSPFVTMPLVCAIFKTLYFKWLALPTQDITGSSCWWQSSTKDIIIITAGRSLQSSYATSGPQKISVMQYNLWQFCKSDKVISAVGEKNTGNVEWQALLDKYIM